MDAPLIAATFGKGKSSKRLNVLLMSNTQEAISPSGFLKLPTNSVMSAPAMKTFFPEVTMRPLTSEDCSNAVTASPNSLMVAWSNLLTLSV